MENISTLIYKCPLCPVEMSAEHLVIQHIKDSHKDVLLESSSTEEATYECPVCYQEFDDVKILNNHVDGHLSEEDADRENQIQDIQIVRIDSMQEENPLPNPVHNRIEIMPVVHNEESTNHNEATVYGEEATGHGEEATGHGEATGHSEEETDDAGEDEEPIEKCILCKKEFESKTALIKHFEDHFPNTRGSNDGNINVSPVDAQEMKQPSEQGEKISKIPALTEYVLYENELVEFVLVLLKVCVITGRENVHAVFQASAEGKSEPKWSRAHAIELLEKKLPEAQHWSRSTLMARMAQAEKMAREFKMTKTESYKTGMGSLETLKDPTLMPNSRKSKYKRPSTEKEKAMVAMINELDQIRENLQQIDVPKLNKFNEKKSSKINVKTQLKAKAFMKTLKFSGASNMDSNEEDEEDQELDSVESHQKIRRGTLVGRSTDKVKEADALRRSSVQALGNKVTKDDDQEVQNVTGLDGLVTVITQLCKKDLQEGSNASDDKVKKIEEKQVELEKIMEKNQQEMEKKMEKDKKEMQENMERNQEDSISRFDDIKKEVKRNTEKQDKVLNMMEKYFEEKNKKRLNLFVDHRL